MLKVILFLLAGGAIIAAGWLLAGIPGHVVASMGSISIDTSAPFAILMLVALFVALFIVLRILRGVWAIPRLGAGWRSRHRLALGEKAVTRVLIALAAGEQGAARKEARRARNFLGESPQTLLLVAEAARLSGLEDEAQEAFQALTMQKDARFLGLRGLLRQAVDRSDWVEAVVIAKEAEAAHPGTIWLRQQRAELALRTENWAEALDLIGPDPHRPAYYVAAADAEPDTSRALAYAKQAWKQDPSFAPAALAYARRLRIGGYEKRARACIANAWKRAPHPDLATFVLAPELNELARAQSAKRLVAGNPGHPESRLLLARVALSAGLTGEARHQIQVMEGEGLNQRRQCLLLAEIEEQERGDTEVGRLAQRDALRRAASADPDPHWQCSHCHADSAVWQPKCASCGNVGTVQWVTGVRASSGLPVIVN